MDDSIHAMTEVETSTVVVAEHKGARTDGPMAGEERVVLDHWLDLYRATVLLKIAGLDAEQLARRSLPPSSIDEPDRGGATSDGG